jgi:hypothetical protein
MMALFMAMVKVWALLGAIARSQYGKEATMTTPMGRIAISFALAAIPFSGAGLVSPAAVRAQPGCDPNYAPVNGRCVPGDRDYDCPELHAMGLGDIPVIGTDWQHLDGYYDYQNGYWVVPPDGLGCEWYGE